MRLLPESARGQRFLAVALALIVLALFYLVFVHFTFVAPYLELGDQYDELRDQQYRFAELIQRRPQIERQLKQVADFEKTNEAFLDDADATSAFSDLSERLKRALDQNLEPQARCTITGISQTPSRTSDVYLRVSAAVVLSCEQETLAKVLYGLESGNPYLFIDRLAIFSTQAVFAPGAKRPPNAGLVNAQFTLSGFLRQPGNAKPGNVKAGNKAAEK